MRTRRTPNPAHQSAHVDSCWLARELGILQSLATAMREAPSGVKDLTPAERSRVRAAALKVRHEVDAILEELA